MIKLESVHKHLLRKDIILFFIGFSALIILNTPIESLLTKTIIIPLLSYVQPKWHTDLIIIFSSLFVILLTKLRFRKYVASKQLLILGILTTVTYLYYRQSETPWTFTSFHWIDSLKYADLLILGVTCQALLFVPIKKEKIKNNSDSLIEDKPIGEEGDDILGYSSYAELLGNKIIKSHFDKSFAIGINGKWGLGKTSFINLLKGTVKTDDIVEINFSPWNSKSPQAIIQDFFDSFNEKVRPYHSSISRLSNEYATKLVQLKSNTLTRSIQLITSSLTNNKPTHSLYDQINTALEEINKKVIIYIDDLDRLDSHEIVEVLRLIRNTANFYNTIFVVAYDRNYIVNALNKHTSFGEIEFLEKIFQLEITLPNFNKSILSKELAEKLKINFPKAEAKTFNLAIIGNARSKALNLDRYLETMRDVTRLTNSITINYSKLEGEVIFKDFLQLELLRLKYPSVYELLFRKKSEFLITKYNQRTGINQYELDKCEKEVILKNYLKNNHLNLSIQESSIDKILSLIRGVFIEQDQFGFNNRELLSVVHPSKFDRYFSYTLLQGNLSEIEFSKARDLNSDQFLDKITEWVKIGLASELKSRFYDIKTFDNQADFEKIIRAIFYLANQPTGNTDEKPQKITNFDSDNLLRKLNNHENSLSKKYYPKNDGNIQIIKFVRSLFDEAKSPYSFEADILAKMNVEFSDIYLIPREERNSLLIQYFKNYCDETSEWNNHIWNLFHFSKKIEWVSNGGNSHTKYEEFTQEGKDIFKNFALNKGLDGFLEAIIETNSFYKGNYSIAIIVKTVFESWENFENELSKKDETHFKNLEEFNRFYKLFASSSHSKAIEFDFKKIAVKY